jgi:hypothetical protein
MCCLALVVTLLGPRVAFALTWLATDRVTVAFHQGIVAPLLGLVFLPWTALLYTLAYAPFGGVSGVGWLFVGLGLVADLGSYRVGRTQRQRALA